MRVRIWFCPSNRAILGRVLEHLGNVFTIWPSYDWDFEISRFRLPGGIKMLKSTGFRTITAMLHMCAYVVVSFQKGHFRPRRRTLELRKTLFYEHFGAAVGIITPLGAATGAAPGLIIIPIAAQIQSEKCRKNPI